MCSHCLLDITISHMVVQYSGINMAKLYLVAANVIILRFVY